MFQKAHLYTYIFLSQNLRLKIHFDTLDSAETFKKHKNNGWDIQEAPKLNGQISFAVNVSPGDVDPVSSSWNS